MDGIETLARVGVVLGTINLVTALTIAFYAGRWIGRTDQRLTNIEQHIGGEK